MKYLNIPTFILSVIAICLCGFLYTHGASHIAGATNSSISAGFDTNLTAPIQSTDTSMSLASNIVNSVEYVPNGYTCFTVDVSTPAQEYICGTVTGSTAYGTAITVSSLQRGVSWITATTTVSSIAQYHSRGADVRITDWPQIGRNANELNGSDTIPNVITYASTVASSSIAMSPYNLVDVDLLNSTSFAGSPNASTIAKGLVQLATAVQQASSTSLGSSAASLVITSSNATDTPQAKCNSLGSSNGAGCAVIALLNGKISQSWLDLTQAFTVSGSWIFSNAVSIAASLSNKLTLNTVAYDFPSSQGSLGTLLKNDGSGNLSWGNATRYLYATTTSITAASSAYATSTVLVIPAGILTASSTITFTAQASASQGSNSSTDELYIRDSVGDTFLGYGIPSTASSGGFNSFIQGQILNMTASSQMSNAIGTDHNSNSNIDTEYVGNTSSVNLSAGVSLVGVIYGGNTGASLEDLTFVVNP